MTKSQDSVFTRIQSLPLFQGINQEELMRMLERTRFNFTTAEHGELIVEQGASATQLVYVLNGKVTASRNYASDFFIEESLEGPLVFQAEDLFSASLTWHYTLRAETDVQLLLISKQDVVTHLMEFPTFRLSLLCFLGRTLEAKEYSLRDITPKLLEASIIHLWNNFMICKQGEKVIHIGMQSLASSLSTSRLSVSKCLNQLQNKGLIKLGRKKILIPNFEDLVNKNWE